MGTVQWFNGPKDDELMARWDCPLGHNFSSDSAACSGEVKFFAARAYKWNLIIQFIIV